jgi:hypothetical protein
MNDDDLIGRIAGIAMTQFNGVGFAHGVYFKITSVEGPGQLKAVCTNPGMASLTRTIPAEQLLQQIKPETIQGQLEPLRDEKLNYAAKCYLTERQDGETDEQLKARLTAIGIGPKGMN